MAGDYQSRVMRNLTKSESSTMSAAARTFKAPNRDIRDHFHLGQTKQGFKFHASKVEFRFYLKAGLGELVLVLGWTPPGKQSLLHQILFLK
ncbi:polyketide synthase [Moniliophthora roreri]|nr:polyketide synthase [Moniliophthora roreri]